MNASISSSGMRQRQPRTSQSTPSRSNLRQQFSLTQDCLQQRTLSTAQSKIGGFRSASQAMARCFLSHIFGRNPSHRSQGSAYFRPPGNPDRDSSV